MVKPYRSRGQVVLELLAAVQSEGPVGITRLASVVNLTHGRIQDQLVSFEQNGLVECRADGDRSAWAITQRGNEALQKLRLVDRAMRDFGINL